MLATFGNEIVEGENDVSFMKVIPRASSWNANIHLCEWEAFP